MITFYIVRHGQTLLNQLERAQGWADSPLTALGEQTARELGQALSSVIFQAAYTSDTIRAFNTAKLVLKERGQPTREIYQDIRLREWCLGTMEAEKNKAFHRTCIWRVGGAVSCDLAENGVTELIADKARELGLSVDVLINNAGFNETGYFTDTRLSEELDMIQVHIKVLTALTKLFLPEMIERGYGRILNVGSTGAYMPCPCDTVYAATKAYVLSFIF